MANYKPYTFTKGKDTNLDGDFAEAKDFGKVRPGEQQLYWKSGFRWYAVPFTQVQRIFRRVEPVYGKLCCGGRSFIIEWLVLVLHDGSELILHIGDDVKRQAEELMLHLQDAHPQLQYGKVYD